MENDSPTPQVDPWKKVGEQKQSPWRKVPEGSIGFSARTARPGVPGQFPDVHAKSDLIKDVESTAIAGSMIGASFLLGPEVGGVEAAATLGVLGAGAKGWSLVLQNIMGNPNVPMDRKGIANAITKEGTKQANLEVWGRAASAAGREVLGAAEAKATQWIGDLEKKYGIQLTAAERLQKRVALAIQSFGRSSLFGGGVAVRHAQAVEESANRAVDDAMRIISPLPGDVPVAGKSVEAVAHDAIKDGRRAFNNQVDKVYTDLTDAMGKEPTVDMTTMMEATKNIQKTFEDVARGAPRTGKASKLYNDIIRENAPPSMTVKGVTISPPAGTTIKAPVLPYDQANFRRARYNQIARDYINDPENKDAAILAKRLVPILTEEMDKAAERKGPVTAELALQARLMKKEGEALFDQKFVAAMLERQPEKLARSMLAHPDEAKHVMTVLDGWTQQPQAKKAIQLNVLHEIVKPASQEAKTDAILQSGVDFFGLKGRLRASKATLDAVMTDDAGKQAVKNLEEISELTSRVRSVKPGYFEQSAAYYQRHMLLNIGTGLAGAIGTFATGHLASAATATTFLATDAVVTRIAYSPVASRMVIKALENFDNNNMGLFLANIERAVEAAVSTKDAVQHITETRKAVKDVTGQ